MSLGRSLMYSGRVVDGFACMDRVMLAISSGRVGVRAAGPAYCAVIASCLERWDVDRARVWTRDLSEWCDAQRGLEPFRGECSVNRASVLRLLGEWDEATTTLVEVCDRERDPRTLEYAYYGVGELCRLVGRRAEAEAAYRRAAELGREVQPGLGLLRRDAGRFSAARSGIARALEASPAPGTRAELLAAQVELEVEHGDWDVAARAAAELRTMADTLGTIYLQAQADRAEARLLIGTDAPEQALPLLRRSWSVWRRLEAPYEAAVTRVLMGRANRASATRRPGSWSSTPPARCSASSGRSPTSTGSSGSRPSPAGPRHPPGSRGGNSRCCSSSPAAGRTGRSRPSSSSASARWRGTSATSSASSTSPNRAAATAFAFEHGLNATA